MKRKSAPEDQELLDQKILERAKLALREDQPRRMAKCVVCSGECAPNSNEGLCWVCRRLKISAWRDSDQQITAQE